MAVLNRAATALFVGIVTAAPPRETATPDSHLFRPLVHSWPLRTVIEVEQDVLTATGLHRGEETEPLGQRRGAETILKTKKCPRATAVKYGRTAATGSKAGPGGGEQREQVVVDRRRRVAESRQQGREGENVSEREKKAE